MSRDYLKIDPQEMFREAKDKDKPTAKIEIYSIYIGKGECDWEMDPDDDKAICTRISGAVFDKGHVDVFTYQFKKVSSIHSSDRVMIHQRRNYELGMWASILKHPPLVRAVAFAERSLKRVQAIGCKFEIEVRFQAYREDGKICISPL